ncbi:MAG: hypothetical protein IPO67_09210 [Deltaproteobacteria bacterium]|nr:hypothetical protein [Deltaproteobacteria bacterium]
MTRAAAFALWILFLSPVSFAQDAAPDSEAAADSGGTDSGGTDSGGTDSGGTDSGGTDSGGTDSGDDGTGADTGTGTDTAEEDAEPTYGAASMAGETGGCQGCASSGGLSVSMAVFGLLLVGLSRRQAR